MRDGGSWTDEPACEPPPPIQLVAFRITAPRATSVNLRGSTKVTKVVAGYIELKVAVTIDGTTIKTGLGVARHGTATELLVARKARLSKGVHTVALSIQGTEDLGGLRVSSSLLSASTN